MHCSLISWNLLCTCSSDRASPAKLAGLLLSFCQQVASGMAYIAYKLYVHGNLAARNVLVSRNDVCKVRIMIFIVVTS